MVPDCFPCVFFERGSSRLALVLAQSKAADDLKNILYLMGWLDSTHHGYEASGALVCGVAVELERACPCCLSVDEFVCYHEFMRNFIKWTEVFDAA